MTIMPGNREKPGAAEKIYQNRNSQRGSVLVMATVLSFAMFMLGLAYLGSIHGLQQDISIQLSDSQSYYAAYAGAIEGVVKVKGGQAGDYNGRWVNYYDFAKYQTQISLGSLNPIEFGFAQGYMVTGNGVSSFYNGVGESAKSIKMGFNTSTYADYLYLSDVERDPRRLEIIRFWTPDTLDGKVHSNDTLHISGSPRFMKRVTSHSSVVDPSNTTAQFDEGLWLNQREIFFPNQYNVIRLHNGYPGWGTFDADSATEITFSGPYIYRRYCGIDTLGIFTCQPENIANALMVVHPPSGALFIEGKVIVKADRGGEDILDPYFVSFGFEGRLTLASSDTMIIPDNLVYRYANYDNSVPTTINDVLGLISENYIMIGEDVGDTVYINAAMAAINGSITVQDIYNYGQTNEKQSLFIYGSLAQRNRGLVHSSYGGGLRGFIEKDYHYDTRLQTHPPPYFLPTSNNPNVYYESFYGDG